MDKFLIIGKVVLVGTLLFVFFRYFGLVSWEKYQSQNVYVSKSWKRPDYLPMPAVTICPQDADSGHSFTNLTREHKNRAQEDEKSMLEYVCEDMQGKDLIECMEMWLLV